MLRRNQSRATFYDPTTPHFARLVKHESLPACPEAADILAHGGKTRIAGNRQAVWASLPCDAQSTSAHCPNQDAQGAFFRHSVVWHLTGVFEFS